MGIYISDKCKTEDIQNWAMGDVTEKTVEEKRSELIFFLGNLIRKARKADDIEYEGTITAGVRRYASKEHPGVMQSEYDNSLTANLSIYLRQDETKI